MNNIKIYYLAILRSIPNSKTLELIKKELLLNRKSKYDNNSIKRIRSLPNEINSAPIIRINSENTVQTMVNEREKKLSGILLTTKDAHTLKDGPTIYLADNLMNLCRFYIQESKIPSIIINELINQIKMNEEYSKMIINLEEELKAKLKVADNTDSELEKNKKPSNILNREKKGFNENTQVIKDNIEQLKKQVSYLSLNPIFIPNSEEHKKKWSVEANTNTFTSNIDENTVKKIMNLEIHQDYKLLVLMGIGVLINNENKEYEEIVKELAQNQKLYLILATSDYIYGTNYQFCHGYIGKDLQQMTQQKILQSMGRIGRNSTQQDYTVRFRDDFMIKKLFSDEENDLETININKLLIN